MEAVSEFKYVGCFSEDGCSQEDVKLRVDEGLKRFGTMMMCCYVVCRFECEEGAVLKSGSNNGYMGYEVK